MKTKFYPTIFFFLLFYISHSSAQDYPSYNLNSAHVRTIQSAIIDGTEYEICVALPEGYEESEEKYPVVYMLGGYESFGLQLQTYQHLAFFKTIPRLILVGINYKFEDKEFYEGLDDYLYVRARDFTPTHLSYKQIVEKHGEEFAEFVPVSGGGEKFLRFIKEELIPFVESEYRADPNDRGIFGYSIGGLFTTYVLFNSPKIFNKIFIGSPALWWDDESIYDFYKSENFAGIGYVVKVYLSVGGQEGPILRESWDNLRKYIMGKKNRKIRLISDILPGERHLTGLGLAHSRAFRRLYGEP
jgi:predicted alpha/beta superfamily hydrolase